MSRFTLFARRLPILSIVVASGAGAGDWKTRVIASGKDHAVPMPPGASATRAEIDWLRSLSEHFTFPTARAAVLAHRFPGHPDFTRSLAREAGDSSRAMSQRSGVGGNHHE